MILVKPATVVQWHRKSFRLHWRRRSRRPGRPNIDAEIRALIRRMSGANPLWGAPRIHEELLKLGIKVSQATVGRWMPMAAQGPLSDLAELPAQSPAHHSDVYALIVLTAPCPEPAGLGRHDPKTALSCKSGQIDRSDRGGK
jgi:hypothetical protein